MIRLNVVLLLAVLASALYLVNVQYESRRLFTELDRAVSQAHQLEVEHDRLQLERREQAAPMRVEKLAREKLQMRLATPAITAYVSYSGVGSAASAPVAPSPALAASTAAKGAAR